MRQALWETSPGALAALLNAGGPLVKADLYTLTLASGTVFRWSGADVAVIGNGQTWSLGPGFKRNGVRFVVGVEVDTLSVSMYDVAGTQINGQGLMAFIRAGGFIGARLQLDRAFWGPDDAQAVGALYWFGGRVAEVARVSRYEAQFSVKSGLELLDVMVPRDVYQAGCPNDLYGPECGASRSGSSPGGVAFTQAGTVSASSDPRRLTVSVSGITAPDGFFALGTATCTSGANTGVARTVRVWSGGVVTVLNPWPVAPAVGDGITLVAGCTKSQTDTNGCPKFWSAAEVAKRYRGQSNIPAAETVL